MFISVQEAAKNDKTLFFHDDVVPDVVHVGKSLKCSWSNWFLDLDGELSNLVLLRTLRDNTHMEIRKSAQGCLHRCSLETKASELVVDNSTSNPASMLTRFLCWEKTLFTRTQKIVKLKNSDGSEKSASFVQVHAICTYEKSHFVTDVAVGTIRLVTSLSKTTAFLKNLGCLYDTFGIHEKGTPAKKVTLREAKENVDKVCSLVQRTVASVKERFNLSRETSVPEGTVSKKTQDSLILLRRGMNMLIENVSSINPSFVDLVELLTLLTTQVENLHAVSHFKHGIFSALNYSQDFGTIVKESLKRITKWAAKYFTHDGSYYHVPDTSMPLSAPSTMALPAVQRVTKEDEAVMKEWMENYRPVRQRAVGSETTKDKAGSLIGSKQFLTTQQRLLLSL